MHIYRNQDVSKFPKNTKQSSLHYQVKFFNKITRWFLHKLEHFIINRIICH